MELATGLCCGMLVLLLLGQCGAKIWEIPLQKSVQDCYNQVEHADIRTYVGSEYSWLCDSTVRMSQAKKLPQFDAQKTSYFKQLYDKSVEHIPHLSGATRAKRQGGLPRCVRKEYRMLSDEERQRFHGAINSLKRDTTIQPNKYDAIARLHEMAPFIAHGGAGFFGWHRVYILMFETALRDVDPSVCLPYWDSSIDNELENPALSSVWTEQFFGTPQGPVVSGPFANWTTSEGVQLIRNVGVDGELFTSRAIEDVLSRTRIEEIITSPVTDPRFDLEVHHGGVHVFCGGMMEQLHTASSDPIFFLLHAFVDHIWELFRVKMAAAGLDPERYPEVDPGSRHHGNASTGLGLLTQADAYQNALTDSYQYDPSPTCTSQYPSCGSRYLTCVERTGRCVPTTWDKLAPPTPTSTPIPNLPPRPIPSATPGTCSNPRLMSSKPVQNDYCCNKTCDTNQWAMIPVKVISVRPPNFQAYKSYPVHNGRVDIRDDIYSPNAYAQTKRFITGRQSNPKTYKRCTGSESIGQVFLSSWGINYDGFYKEAAIIDQRLAVSVSMGFVAVRKPSMNEPSMALIRAHDSCGRVCHAACADAVTNQYKPCKGAITISTDQPLMYGSSYDEAVLNVFDYEFNNDYPKFKSDNFFITFYCDYHNNFPYAEHGHEAPHTTVTATIPPVLSTAATPTECQVTPGCILDVPCASDGRQCSRYNERHPCRGSCQAYALCTYGSYFLRVCPEGQYFDDSLKTCVKGQCRNMPGSGGKSSQINSRSINNHRSIGGIINSVGGSTKRNISLTFSNPRNTGSFYTNLLSTVLRPLGG